MKRLCQDYDVPFIINDNVEIAIKCGADGVHVGQKDMEAGKVRELVGEDMIIGYRHSLSSKLSLQKKAGADYLGVGAVFSTTTKLDAADVDFDTLKDICNAVTIPVVAIGGNNRDNNA